LQNETESVNDLNCSDALLRLEAAFRERRLRLGWAEVKFFVDGFEVVFANSLLSAHDYVVPSLLQFFDLYRGQICVHENDINVSILPEKMAKLIQLSFAEVVGGAHFANADKAAASDTFPELWIGPLVVGVKRLIVIDD